MLTEFLVIVIADVSLWEIIANRSHCNASALALAKTYNQYVVIRTIVSEMVGRAIALHEQTSGHSLVGQMGMHNKNSIRKHRSKILRSSGSIGNVCYQEVHIHNKTIGTSTKRATSISIVCVHVLGASTPVHSTTCKLGAATSRKPGAILNLILMNFRLVLENVTQVTVIKNPNLKCLLDNSPERHDPRNHLSLILAPAQTNSWDQYWGTS